jgi:UDP-N-acetylmuramate dehydrogenase
MDSSWLLPASTTSRRSGGVTLPFGRSFGIWCKIESETFHPMLIYNQEPLASRTTLQLGGRAERLLEACSESEVMDIIRDARAQNQPWMPLGGGSNLVVADEGVRGWVVCMANRGLQIVQTEEQSASVYAAAGESWDDVVAFCVQEKLAGVECLSGIPGLVGATPIQNVGAYGQEVSDTIELVRVYDCDKDEVVMLSNAECGFSYRDSYFKQKWTGKYVVLGVQFRLSRTKPTPSPYAELRRALAARGVGDSLSEIREVIIELRRGKSMVLDEQDPNSRSAGSFFTNPIVSHKQAQATALRARHQNLLRDQETMPQFSMSGTSDVKLAAGWLIERSGFHKGYRKGKVGVSEKHALALVNFQCGSTSELIALAREIQQGVFRTLGVVLRPEPVMVGFASDPLAFAPPQD